MFIETKSNIQKQRMIPAGSRDHQIKDVAPITTQPGSVPTSGPSRKLSEKDTNKTDEERKPLKKVNIEQTADFSSLCSDFLILNEDIFDSRSKVRSSSII